MLRDHAEKLLNALRQKGIALKIRCGSEDEDCLPMARQLHDELRSAGLQAELDIQRGSRHQFPGVENEKLQGE